MQVVDVQEVLAKAGHGGRALRMRRLGALRAVREPYFALLCQPNGTIHASSARIGNADSQGAAPMYRTLLEHAVGKQAQLVVTPEYSVPWQLVADIALTQGAARPPDGSLWALGCESITPTDLEELQLAVNQKADVRLIHEGFDPQQKAQKAFVDPLVFVFWAVDEDGADVLCLLVQFKTTPCRDADHVELQSLYLGTKAYRFTADPGDASLLALICSDAFAFTDALIAKHDADLLLLHIQLNKKPAYVDYAAYRSRLFSVASNNSLEILCLNWASNVLVEGEATPWNAISGSAWYVAPRGVVVDDAAVNELHCSGSA